MNDPEPRPTSAERPDSGAGAAEPSVPSHEPGAAEPLHRLPTGARPCTRCLGGDSRARCSHCDGRGIEPSPARPAVASGADGSRPTTLDAGDSLLPNALTTLGWVNVIIGSVAGAIVALQRDELGGGHPHALAGCIIAAAGASSGLLWLALGHVVANGRRSAAALTRLAARSGSAST